MNHNPNQQFDQNSYYSYFPSGAFGNAPHENVQTELKQGEADRFGKISMILGIIALVAMITCCVGFFFVGTLVLGILSLVYANKSKKASPDNRFEGKALAGLICSIISLVILVATLALVVFYVFLFLMLV